MIKLYKYIKDALWSLSLKLNTCPYCHKYGSLKVTSYKGTTKTVCSNCSFTGYGNISKLAYKKQLKPKAVVKWAYNRDKPENAVNRKYTKLPIKLFNGFKSLDKKLNIKKAVKVECKHKNKVFDSSRGEEVCTDCGLVLRGSPHYIGGSLKVVFDDGAVWGDNDDFI